MRSDNAGNWRCCLPDTLILCFLQKLLLFGNRTCPEYRLTAQLGRDFQPTLLAPVLHLHRLAAAFNDGLLSSSQSFFFLTCFYEAGMRVHSDAIDYKTRIAALSSGMGRFSWSKSLWHQLSEHQLSIQFSSCKEIDFFRIFLYDKRNPVFSGRLFLPTLLYHWIFIGLLFPDCLENRIGLPAISNMLNWRTVGALRQPPDTLWKEVGAMITYSELFQFVMMLCAVITLVIYISRKK